MFSGRRERCAHCGRSYSRSQWVKVSSWCSSCQKYICHECLGPRGHCPECGTRTSKIIEGMAGAFLIGGSIFLGFFLLISPFTFMEGDPFRIVLLMLLIIVPLWAGFLITYPISRTRRKKHRSFIIGLPKGIIPREKRNITGLNQLKRKYKEIDGIYPKGVGEHLKCYWMTPVMSKEEFAVYQKRFRRYIWTVSAVMTFIGIAGILGSVLLFPEPILLMVMGILIFIGLLMLVVNIIGKKLDKRDRFRGTAAFWKKVGFKNTYTKVEEYLSVKELRYKKTVQKDTKNSRWTNPFYKYHIGDDLRIETHYLEQRDGNVTGHLQIVYKDSSYELARTIQDDLDVIFWEQDLLNNRSSMVRVKRI